jgi:hypothetical protein
VVERNWPAELATYLQETFASSCAALRQPLPFSGLRINPPLGKEESQYFLLGLEAGLFYIDTKGNVRSDVFLATKTANVCALFRHDPPPARFSRETVCQLSTASMLILKRGWLKNHVLIESMTEENRSLAGGGDIMITSEAGHLVVAAKVKRSVPELEKLIKDLRTCCNRGAHALDDCGFPQNHPVFEFCADYRPLYFWGVAPGADVCLQMKYGGNLIEIKQLVSLPPRSVIELNWPS